MSKAQEHCDVLIIGAGPAGLTAACYLARYRRRVIVVHDGRSRALHIPLTHNAPGFPGGVAGAELIQRMQDQAELYGATIQQDHIDGIEVRGDSFHGLGGLAYTTRSVILATGIELKQVDLPHAEHEAAIASGCLRYCPVCDGYEATGRAVGVLGSDVHGAREALFLRQYSPSVTLLAKNASDLSTRQRKELAAAGVEVVDSPVRDLVPLSDGMSVGLSDGRRLRFDVLYPALGCTPNSGLAKRLGIDLTPEGCIPTNSHQELTLAGVYAAGDVVDGLDQISVAVGHGAVAATRAHNYLREHEGAVLKSD
jgi:thioredoxin reductase (NADPH)